MSLFRPPVLGLYLIIRTLFVYTTLIAGAWCVFSTEMLSALHGITLPGILLCWLPPVTVAGWYGVRCRDKLVGAVRRGLAGVRSMGGAAKGMMAGAAKGMMGVLLLVIFVSLLLAVVYPPNNYDSMTYHMARVAHWIQNKSIAFYPTHIGRQLVFQPLAEWIILHIQLLTGSDRLANAVQLFFFVGCMVVVTLITRELGGDRRRQLLSAFLTGMLPMAIAQSNTTQNDVVAAYFVLCFAWCTLVIRRSADRRTIIFAGISLGLSWLTKGTAYIFTLPFACWYLLPLIGRVPLSQRVRLALRFMIVPLMAVGLNLGFYYRNFSATGSPLGTASNDLANEGRNPAALALVGVKDLVSHFPVTEKMKMQLVRGAAVLGLDADDPRYSYTSIRRMATGFHFDEDYGQNFLHTVLIIGFSLYFLTRKHLYQRRPDLYSLFVLTLFATAALFCLLLKWQPWANRLETPIFMLYCIFLAFSWDTLRTWVRAVLMTSITGFGLAYLLLSAHHPVLPLRDSLLYKSYDSYIYSDGLLACGRYLDGKPYMQLGIVIGGDSWDYPYYKLLGQRRRLEHVMVENRSAIYDKGFAPEAILIMDTSRLVYQYKDRRYYRTQVFSGGLAVYEQR